MGIISFNTIIHHHFIPLFRSITVFCGSDSILQNIPHIQTDCLEYFAEYCSPTEHCYGSENCSVEIAHIPFAKMYGITYIYIYSCAMQRVFSILWPAGYRNLVLFQYPLSTCIWKKRYPHNTGIYPNFELGFLLLRYFKPLQLASVEHLSPNPFMHDNRQLGQPEWMSEGHAISCHRRNVDDRESALIRLMQSTSS